MDMDRLAEIALLDRVLKLESVMYETRDIAESISGTLLDILDQLEVISEELAPAE